MKREKYLMSDHPPHPPTDQKTPNKQKTKPNQPQVMTPSGCTRIVMSSSYDK